MYTSIFNAISEGAKKYPERLCVTDTEHTYTYSGFLEKASFFCDRLRESGVKKGQAVVVRCTQDADYLALQAGVQKLGAVFVPLEKTVSELQLEDTKRLLKDAVFAEDISEILFTTGTTGKSKGVVLSHKACIAVAENVAAAVDIKEGNVELIPTPLNHSFSLRRYYANMISGGSVVVLNGVLNIKKYFDAIETYSGTSLVMVPAVITAILKLSKEKLKDYEDRIRYIQVGSAPMTEKQKEALKALLPNTPMYNIFGSTEAGCSTYCNFNSSDDYPGCIGKPTRNSIIRFLDEDGNLISNPDKDHPGRLLTGGSMLMEEYFNDPEETAKAMHEGEILSSDLGYSDERGNICLVGRAGDVINVKGHKVAPSEVEEIALTFPGISDCAAAAMEDKTTGQAVRLYVVMEKGIVPDRIAIRSFLAERLEAYKIPKTIVTIDKIPRTFNGKILRRELK